MYLFDGQKGTYMFPSIKRYIYVPFLLKVKVQYQEKASAKPIFFFFCKSSCLKVLMTP